MTQHVVLDASAALEVVLPFDMAKMVTVGRRVRALYPSEAPERVRAKVDDEVVRGWRPGWRASSAGRSGSRRGSS